MNRMDRSRLFRRAGCLLLLIPWFICLLSPCIIIALAVQREIVLTQSDLPDHVFRVWVLQERNAQGLGIATSRRVDISGPVNDISNVACTIVDVRFLLWNGSAEESGALPSHQCGCYTRETSAWTPIALGPDACKIAGE